jgi:hypothetical protein
LKRTAPVKDFPILSVTVTLIVLVTPSANESGGIPEITPVVELIEAHGAIDARFVDETT